jgi:hypothetical protein
MTPLSIRTNRLLHRQGWPLWQYRIERVVQHKANAADLIDRYTATANKDVCGVRTTVSSRSY